MATPRRELIDPDVPLCYHLVSRCVRRSWLCGFDRQSRRDYSHRKDWLTARLKQLASAFAVDVYAYAIMSNHFHLVVYYDPSASQAWTGLEVAQRWFKACPPKLPDGSVDESQRELQIAELLANSEHVAQIRKKLASLSLFMKLLKQPIARRANLEDQCQGHFFDQRFYSGALLSEDAILAAMAYVDLNPVRAKIAQSIAEAEHTSAHERLFVHADSLDDYLTPIVSGIGAQPVLTVTLREYVEHLEALLPEAAPRWSERKLRRWREHVATLKRRQRVFGPQVLLQSWIATRGWRQREVPLPL